MKPRVEFIRNNGSTQVFCDNLSQETEEGRLNKGRIRESIWRAIKVQRFASLYDGEGSLLYTISDPKFVLTEKIENEIRAIVENEN